MITWIAVVSLLVLFPAWKERNLKFVHRAACFLETFNIKSLNRIRSVHFYSRVSCMGGCVLSCVQLLRPQGLQPARLLCPWDSPGNNTAWVALSLSRRSSRPRHWPCISCLAGFFTTEPSGKPLVRSETIEWIRSVQHTFATFRWGETCER